MKIKQGVDVRGIRPEIMLAIMAAEEAFGEYGVIVTSVCEGRHSATSLHYAGQAIDLRIRHLPDSAAPVIADRLRDALTEDYDVVLEGNHIHVEYQPRRR